MIDIRGIDKAQLLLALWRNAGPQYERHPIGEPVEHVIPATTGKKKLPERRVLAHRTELRPVDRGELTLEGARMRVAPHPRKTTNYFSHVLGRELMVNIEGGHIRAGRRPVMVPLGWLHEEEYDRRHGAGTARRAVDEARALSR